MKSALLIVVYWLSFSAFAAANDGALIMSAPKAPALQEKDSITEVGFQYSSINEGTPFATVALAHEWDNGFVVGARGLLPMTYSDQRQAYMGQIFTRFIFLNEKDQMFIEPSVSQGYFNGGGPWFAMLGTGFGYLHKFTETLAAGGTLGADYSSSHVSHGYVSNEGTFYNRFAITGSYYF